MDRQYVQKMSIAERRASLAESNDEYISQMTGATPLSFAASPSRNSRDKAAFPHARPLTTPGRAIPSAIPHNLLPSAPASPPTPAPSPTPHQRAPSWSNAGENEDAFLKDARAHFSGLGGPERQRFLAELLNLCNSQLLSFVHSFVSPRLKRDPFQALPTELCLRVLAFIDDPKTLARASQVSRRWHELLADDMTWKNLCDKHAYRRLSQESSMHHGRSRSSAPGRPSPYIHIPRSASYDPSWTGPSSSTPDLPSHSLDDTNTAKSAISKIRPISYKSHFKQRYMVETAWRSGGTAVSRHITPDQGVVTSLHLTDKYIVAALDNAKIHVFDTDGNNQKTLQGHVMGVWAMVPWDDILVSGGCDRDVRVWNMATGQSIHTLRGHTSTVRCLKMSDANTAISGSRDTTLRIWDLVNGVCKNVLIGHQASVRCLEINGDLVVSGSYDTTARIWSISGGRCLRVLTGHFSQIYAIAFDGKRIVTGSLDTSVRVWDPASGQCQAILQGHTSLVGQLQMRGDTLVTGGSDGSVRIWSLRKMAPIHRLAAHDNSVTSLQFDDARVVSGGSDGRVKVWDMETGHLVRELGTPAEQVWRVAFEEEKAVIMGSRQQRTVMEVWSFSPPEEVVQEDRSSRSPVSAPEQTMPDYVGEPMAEQVEASTTAPTDLTMDDAMEGAIDP